MKIFASILLFVAAGSACAASDDLKTRGGTDIGMSFSSYQYQEPGLMSLQGAKLGLDLRGTQLLESGGYLRGDLRYALGSVDYTSNGTGSSSGHPEWYVEARALIGRDWTSGDAVFSPYFGFGYRYLFNDMRGISCVGNTCYVGYRRESSYFYIPIGITHRAALSGGARLVSEVEYDHLMAGQQVTRLSDTGLGYGDQTNTQGSGYGVKMSVRYEQDEWSVGPFMHYWNIGKSEVALVYRNGVPVGIGWEPGNNTIEVGIRAGKRF